MTIQTQGVGEWEYLTFGDNTDPAGGGVGVLNVLVTIQTQGMRELEYLTFGDKTNPGGGGVRVLNVW